MQIQAIRTNKAANSRQRASLPAFRATPEQILGKIKTTKFAPEEKPNAFYTAAIATGFLAIKNTIKNIAKIPSGFKFSFDLTKANTVPNELKSLRVLGLSPRPESIESIDKALQEKSKLGDYTRADRISTTLRKLGVENPDKIEIEK